MNDTAIKGGFRLNDDSTLEEIQGALEADGYSPSLARRVKVAFAKGTLVWTTNHIVFTDDSRPNEFWPNREEGSYDD
jgi:hypothetical protein